MAGLPSRRSVLRAAIGAAAVVVGAGAFAATRPRHPRWHTDVVEPDPVQVLSPAAVGVFGHSVASGGPLADRVVLWTRISAPVGHDDVPVEVSVATDPDLHDVVGTYRAVASSSDDFCVHIDAGGLTPDTTYYYRFVALGERSPLGRTRTLPTGPTPVRLGFAACASYGHGRFWPYAHLARRSDLHAVVHLGDYIYDTPGWGHPGTYGTSRQVDPPQGCVSLEDYRARYRQYRADPQLAELHRQHPVIPIWDDHEFADDPRDGGATGHDPSLHGYWGDRVRAAARAWHEWMPVRDLHNRLWRRFEFGTTAELVLVDRHHDTLWGSATSEVAGTQRRFLLNRARRSKASWLLLGSGAGTSSRRADGSGGWDQELRAELFAALGTAQLLSLGGDSHRFDALELRPGEDTTAVPVATEFAVSSVSSPGGQIDRGTLGDHVRFADADHRGYAVLTCTPERAQVDFFAVPDASVRSDDEPDEVWLAGFVTHPGSGSVASAAEPAAPLDGPPPAP